MKRWALWVLLLLSLGVNVGILATLLVQHWRQPPAVDPAFPDWLDADPTAEPEPAAPAPPAVHEPASPARPAATPPSSPRRAEPVRPRPTEPPTPTRQPETLETVPAVPAAPEAAAPLPAAPVQAAPVQAAPEAALPPSTLAEPAAPRADRVFQNLADRLGLAGEPRDRFLAVQRGAFESMRGERQRLWVARAALRRELAAPSPDQARVDALLAEATAAQSAMEQTLVSSLLKSRAMLNPEQQRMYMRFVEERLRPAASMSQRRAGRERFPGRRAGRP